MCKFLILTVAYAQDLVQDDGAEGSGTDALQKDDDLKDMMFISGLLTSSKDLFQKTVAYEFSSAFFKARGLRSSDQLVLLNGVLLNKPTDGRMEWTNIGGLNDALRYQEVFARQLSSPYALGRMGPTVNFSSYAENYSPGTKYSLAFSNRTYSRRWMISYFSGWTKQNWKFSLSASARTAEQGYRLGTNYASYAFLASADKVFRERHHFNGTFIYTNTVSGRSAPLTREVYEIKGPSYNPYWGIYNGKQRNSREKRTVEPIVQLNHRWQINEKSRLENHLTLQFGERGRSRMDYSGSRELRELRASIGGGANPDPTYYQYLPSYFLRSEDNPDLSGAYLAKEALLGQGQLDWEKLRDANQNRVLHSNAIYALYEDVTAEKLLSIKSEYHLNFGKNMAVDFALTYHGRKSNNYARMLDLLGGEYYLDVNSYEEQMERKPNDLRDPGRKVLEGERHRYNYEVQVKQLMAYARILYTGPRLELYAALQTERCTYQRKGIYENGRNPGKLSLGKGPETEFVLPGFKAGVTYKLSGRHLMGINGAYLHLAPGVQNSYFNIRESHERPLQVKAEKQLALDAFYLWRSPLIHARLSLYSALIKDRSQLSFYYADGLNSLGVSGGGIFVQEMMTGADVQSSGVEISVGYRLGESLLLKAVGALGRVHFANDPSLFVSSDDLDQASSLGRSYLRGYYLGGGPQNALSVGFEYSDPNYWWFAMTGNYFDRSYVQVAPVLRSQNFIWGNSGLPKKDLDQQMVTRLLEQEKLPSYWTINLVGGKSWKLGKCYLGFFVSLNNALNVSYRTGGFEQSRKASYESLLADKSREYPLFGNKYWFGYGASYFASLYLRM